ILIRVAELESQKDAQFVSVARGSTLPSLRIGVAGERVGRTDSYLGVSAGISIPLWGGSGTVKTAKAQKTATELRTRTIQTDIRVNQLELVRRAEQIRESLSHYESLRHIEEGIRLLSRSFELQQISVLEYFTQLAFYSQTRQEYLELELKLHQALAELTKYRL
ncbi:MAG: TolC family protein, partial [Rikenellaceae bacterium]|nr:TolC family protein [Rikenellaceae bacterium]